MTKTIVQDPREEQRRARELLTQFCQDHPHFKVVINEQKTNRERSSGVVFKTKLLQVDVLKDLASRGTLWWYNGNFYLCAPVMRRAG